ncbi:MAG: HAD family hydrolase [bacterium]
MKGREADGRRHPYPASGSGDAGRPKLLVYDCDGVILDSKGANEAFYNHILERFGMPPLHGEQLEFVHVSTARGAVEHLFHGTPWIEEARAYLEVVDNTPFIPLLRLEPHIHFTLRRLRAACRTAIATNRGMSMPLIIKEHRLGELFDLVVTCLDVRHPKPHPECLLTILGHFRLQPQEALYIGDSEVDQLVAEGAGVPFASYKNKDLNARYYLDDHREVLVICGLHPEE